MSSQDNFTSGVTFDPLINEKELCRWLGIATATASRWRYNGSGPKFIQLGKRRISYRKSEIERWISEREFSSERKASASDPDTSQSAGVEA